MDGGLVGSWLLCARSGETGEEELTAAMHECKFVREKEEGEESNGCTRMWSWIQRRRSMLMDLRWTGGGGEDGDDSLLLANWWSSPL